jgi:hypothetical protein
MKWDESSDSPPAYGDWDLHYLRAGSSLKKVASLGRHDSAPFDDANKHIDNYNEKRKAARWSEVEIGARKPGEEGPKGGRPIPMQTQKGRR